MQLGQHDTATLVESAAYTASFNSGAVLSANVDEIIAYLNISAASGTSPTLDITIQDTPDGTNWYDVTSFAQATGTGKQRIVLSNIGSQVRAKVTMAGTSPNFTFSVELSGKN